MRPNKASFQHTENHFDLDRNLIGQAAKANGRTRMLATGKSRAPARKIVCLGSPKKMAPSVANITDHATSLC
jgi:hypothetical protein